MARIADIQVLEDGRVYVELANKRGITFENRQEIAKVVQRMSLELKIALILSSFARPREAIGADVDLASIVQVTR
jgi:hypothetical protein